MSVDLTRGESARILSVAGEMGLTPAETAYVLATAHWETAASLLPVREAYYLGEKAAAYRAGLRYAPWYGRGFVQLTWKANYARAGEALGIDLLAEPDLALDADVAARVLVQGMVGGWFTGRRLSHFITEAAVDYTEARRIINGLDCATEVAALADAYALALDPVSTPVLRRGMQGAPVVRLQRALGRAGQTVKADGTFGVRTEAALCRFQSLHQLAADGIAGPQSWTLLLSFEETTP